MSAEEALIEAALAYAERMPGGAFLSHIAAAVLWELPLPLAVVRGRALDVCVHAPRRAPAGRGVAGHVVHPALAHAVRHPVHGVAVSSPASTWAMLGSVLPDVRDLVAVADAVIREPMHRSDPPSLASRAQLEAAVAAGRRLGAARLRAALPSANSRSRSRAETWLRVLLVGAGLPEPVANMDVVEGGLWLGQLDLAYPELRVAIEYEGEHHLTDPRQWAADIARYDRLVEAGWRVIRVTKAEVFGRSADLVARVRRALERPPGEAVAVRRRHPAGRSAAHPRFGADEGCPPLVGAHQQIPDLAVQSPADGR